MKILIADDDEDARCLFQTAFAGWGCGVETARDGAQGLERARLNSPDLILSDVMMPVMDGFMFCRKVKTDPDLKKIPFILYTATRAQADEEELARRLGAARFLRKPLALQELRRVVMEEVARGGGAAPGQDGDGVGLQYMEVLSRKLREGQERLFEQRKYDLVGRLSAGVAHDLNNLLGPIMGYSEFLSQSLAAADPRQADLREISRAAERAARLIKQLMAFSRKQPLEPRLVSINAVVASAKRLLSSALAERTVLKVSLGPEPGEVLIDPGQLEQALLNLVIAASDRMPDGGEIEISTGRSEAAPGACPGGCVVLKVKDSGPAMDQVSRERVFEPFFASMKPGSGLRFPTALGIIKQSGGEILVESGPGAGNEFRICLPPAGEGRGEGL